MRSAPAPSLAQSTALGAGRYLAWGCAALGVLSLLPRLFVFLQLGASLLGWTWQFDYDEGINLHATLEIAHGHNIYHHNGPEGFISAPYPPIFYILNAPFQLAGPTFGPGRALSLLATVAIALLLAYITWKITSVWGAGVFAGAVWLSLSPVIVWSALYKQDMLALAFGLGGLAVALTSPRGARLVFAAGLFALGFYTKQSALAAAAATAVWLIVRDLRGGLRFSAILGAMLVAPFLAGNLLLKGGLAEHLLGNHAVGWNVGPLRQAMRKLWGENWPFLNWAAGVIAGLVVWTFNGLSFSRSRERLGSGQGLVLIYAGVGGAAGLAQSGYEGANYNHLLDLLLPLCLLVGLSVAWLLRWQGSTSQIYRYAGLALVAVALAAQLFAFNDPRSWYHGGWPGPERDLEMTRLSAVVARTPGDIFSEDNYLLLRNNKPVVYEDSSTFAPLAQMGNWDDRTFNQSLRDRRFSLVILMRGSTRWTAAGQEAFNSAYALKFPGSLDTFEPRLFPNSPQYARDCTLTLSGDNIALKGYSLAPGVAQNGLKRGDTLRVALYWQPQAQPTGSYASYVQVLNEKGEKVAGRDNPQTGAEKPTKAWEPSHILTDTTGLPLPDSIAPGRYRLLTGMYLPQDETLQPLKAACTAGETYGDAVSLGWVEIK